MGRRTNEGMGREKEGGTNENEGGEEKVKDEGGGREEEKRGKRREWKGKGREKAGGGNGKRGGRGSSSDCTSSRIRKCVFVRTIRTVHTCSSFIFSIYLSLLIPPSLPSFLIPLSN